MNYRPPVPQVCNDCPFRRKAMPGWLGASSPEGFIDCMERDEPLPCHQTIDYDNNPHWLVEWLHQKTGHMCAGALQFMANKVQQHPFQRMEKDHDNVFSNTVEFVRFHRESAVHSWDEDDQTEGAKMRRQLIADTAARMKQPIVDFKNRKSRPAAKRKARRK